jgi:hypothetical protein
MSPRTLDPADWTRVMLRLATELSPDRQRRVTLIGGVAMALGYRSRRTTTDADAIMAPGDTEEILSAAKRIAPDFQLDAGWLNQKAFEAGLIKKPEAERIVFETPTLVLEVPSPESMLAMKLARSAGDTDLDDARSFCGSCGAGMRVWRPSGTCSGGSYPWRSATTRATISSSSGKTSMNPGELVNAVLTDDLAARQLVKDAKRADYEWSSAPAPDFSDLSARAVYAGVVELLAERAGELPPAWAKLVGASPKQVFLMGAKYPAQRREFLVTAPDALKKRNVYASPEYLDVL